ncbi:MAG: dienelactone hydrolase family protein [Clostridia bacterium]|nr:dienelactone hydrolase family protein [Clostridia bacterium]
MQYEIKNFESLEYLVRYPNGYESGKKYPVILHLHGAGGRYQGAESNKTNPFFTITEQDENFPFVCVSPSCNADTWFDLFETLRRFVKFISAEPYANAKKLYLLGPSMGGYTTWQLATSLPEYFAAIAPICGGGMYWNAGRLVNVPVWAFHGELDGVVRLEESEKMVNAVNANGGNAKLTVYKDTYHDSWNQAYANPELFAWLLSHENENATELKNEYKGSDIYG